jgi:hypothetical protein
VDLAVLAPIVVVRDALATADKVVVVDADPVEALDLGRAALRTD